MGTVGPQERDTACVGSAVASHFSGQNPDALPCPSRPWLAHLSGLISRLPVFLWPNHLSIPQNPRPLAASGVGTDL